MQHFHCVLFGWKWTFSLQYVFGSVSSHFMRPVLQCNFGWFFPKRLPGAGNSANDPISLSRPVHPRAVLLHSVSFSSVQLSILTDAQRAFLRGKREKSLQGTWRRIANWDPCHFDLACKIGAPFLNSPTLQWFQFLHFQRDEKDQDLGPEIRQIWKYTKARDTCLI